ncbi:DUF1957 domain-containing protein [Clostridiaceae bacterium UIB06]|uniref:DUF1957 domain-containing protein n=1 Tax=Clostridium thailandense TaxID=2794346 RepID=A0A949TM70_9CLOT|nr:1,4-alpha-glucan branching protein domain-containing protein [Clostridium thailandense]MBV7275439.1 DUF1957 domain-containing protein [Clostridium thailandense]MCH5136700.1 DUF1957 domain-containing protein [Clostridiaceae bacterium UIB06]
MNQGYVSIILHSHMPFVRHPEVDDSLEERWLFEAISECYLPLINVYDNLIKDDINFKITMSITPTLMSMLEDSYLQNRYLEYLEKSIDLSEKEKSRTKNDKALNKLAYFYNERFNNLMSTYKNYDYNLMNAFRKFDDLGKLELITSAATHGLLPLLMANPETVIAQLATGIQSYIDSIGHVPKGIWLPECAYTYSLDRILKDLGIEYFISESTAVLNASPKPRYGTYAPIATPNGVCTFGRDIEASHQVWSNFTGYPGDPSYREFYRDIGFELPMEYIKPYINKGGIRLDTGVKYYKITEKTDNKEYYNRRNAMEKVNEHAKHFVSSRHNQISCIYKNMEQPPIIVCPYDTELFGHWWFEGPEFIDNVIRRSAEERVNYEIITPSQYLGKYPMIQCSNPCPSSWGENGDYSVWMNPSNDWVYKEIHGCAENMKRLARIYDDPNDLQKRALNQAARELMLAEASDWTFMIKNNTTDQYAVERVKKHVERFNKLYEDITKDTLESIFISKLEELDNIFKNINYKVYKKDVY